jgi:POT family proton-dependent oligopeptide transporter
MKLATDLEPGSASGGGASALGLSGHPRALRPLFFAELWERFSYYGMRALLVLFMVAPASEGGLGMTAAEAALVYGNYTMAVYLLSIPGGVAADTLIGARPSVLIGGAVIAAGHFTLAVAHPWALYAGLVLVALGTGLFKPNIGALVGALYGAHDTRRDAGFSLFYMGINIGGFLAPLVTGFLAQSPTMKGWLAARGFDPVASWHWGFAAAGVGMVIGLLILASTRGLPDPRPARAEDPAPSRETSPFLWLAVVTAGTLALMGLIVLSDRPGFELLRWAYVLVPAAVAVWLSLSPEEEPRRYGAMFVLLIGAMIFWAIFEQAGVTIALFADQLTRSEVAGLAFPSAWFQSLNPLFVILLAPLFAALWIKLGERQPSSPVKFGLGLAFLALSFLLMVPASILAAEGRVSPLWLVGLFFLQTVGEMLLSPVGLSTMTRLAPARAVGLALGIWFLGAALGNKLAGVLATGFQSAEPSALSGSFLWQAGLAGLAALAFFALTPWIKRLMGSVR